MIIQFGELLLAMFILAIIVQIVRSAAMMVHARRALSKPKVIDDSFLDELVERPELPPEGLFDMNSNHIETIHKQEEMERIKQATMIGVYTPNYGRGMVAGQQRFAAASCASVASSLGNLAAAYDSHFAPRKPKGVVAKRR